MLGEALLVTSTQHGAHHKAVHWLSVSVPVDPYRPCRSAQQPSPHRKTSEQPQDRESKTCLGARDARRGSRRAVPAAPALLRRRVDVQSVGLAEVAGGAQPRAGSGSAAACRAVRTNSAEAAACGSGEAGGRAIASRRAQDRGSGASRTVASNGAELAGGVQGSGHAEIAGRALARARRRRQARCRAIRARRAAASTGESSMSDAS